jgi:hypothetical protein
MAWSSSNDKCDAEVIQKMTKRTEELNNDLDVHARIVVKNFSRYKMVYATSGSVCGFHDGDVSTAFSDDGNGNKSLLPGCAMGYLHRRTTQSFFKNLFTIGLGYNVEGFISFFVFDEDIAITAVKMCYRNPIAGKVSAGVDFEVPPVDGRVEDIGQISVHKHMAHDDSAFSQSSTYAALPEDASPRRVVRCSYSYANDGRWIFCLHDN